MLCPDLIQYRVRAVMIVSFRLTVDRGRRVDWLSVLLCAESYALHEVPVTLSVALKEARIVLYERAYLGSPISRAPQAR